MSKAIIETFFPDVANFLQELSIPKIYDVLLPDDVVSLCPEPVLTLGQGDNSITTRNPMLSLGAIWGIGIGIRGYKRYSVRRNSNHIGNLWGGAFLNFAMMNITGLLVHCLAPSIPKGRLYADQYPVWWALDCYFTGVSALLLVGGGISTFRQSLIHEKVPLLDHVMFDWKPKTWIIFANAIGLLAIGTFIFLSTTQASSSNMRIRTLPVELFYLVPLVLAGEINGPLLLSERHLQQKGFYIFISGGVWFVANIILDATLCRFTRGIMLDAFMASTGGFLGSDLAFAGLAMWLDAKLSATSSADVIKKKT
mmetsp:Transcript_15200/g.23642  ORF Transcript_15200/g.23642 Transcript_15200/m.23642 type:complete len:310 (-) Transcript_15200:153-1082(-)